jgi:hypothetical protein
MKRLQATLLLACLLISGAVFSEFDIQTPEGRDQERQRIETERSAADLKFEAQDRECQTRFIVTSCRNNVRLERMRSNDGFKRQESILNRLDHQAAAAKQQKKLEDKAQ